MNTNNTQPKSSFWNKFSKYLIIFIPFILIRGVMECSRSEDKEKERFKNQMESIQIMEDTRRDIDHKQNNLPPETVEEKKERLLKMLNEDSNSSNEGVVDSTSNQ
jgi:hypothetical protein